MTWTVTLVPPEAVNDLWPTVAPLLEPALVYAGGRIDLVSVKEWLDDQRYLLWVAYPEDKIIRVAFATREARYPRRSMLVIDVCGGSDMRGWVSDATRIFQSFARDRGFDGVEMFGRRGWTGALKPHGWSETTVLCEIEAAKQVDHAQGR